ncbi:hypothetical protein ACQKWADRAFT_306956 [Trichoderma austrokoningii]
MACKSISSHIPGTTPSNRSLHHIPDDYSIINDQSIAHTRRVSTRHSRDQAGYSIPDSWGHLSELAPISPVENPNESSLYRHRTLEECRRSEGVFEQEREGFGPLDAREDQIATVEDNASKCSDKLRTWFCLPSACIVM